MLPTPIILDKIEKIPSKESSVYGDFFDRYPLTSFFMGGAPENVSISKDLI